VMLILSIVFLLVAICIASMNIAGCIVAYRRRQKGIEGGYSNIPILSLLLCGLAWLTGREYLKLWMFIPALVDPGTWALIALPFFLAWNLLKRQPASRR